MRTLKFIVDKQSLTKDPDCDFSGLVPGTEGYIEAQFSFSPEWNNCVKVAGFYTPMGQELTPQVLKDGRSCLIPAEALARNSFKINVLGKRSDIKLTTNKVTISQNGGKA